MAAPKRRITVAERDRALRLRGKLTTAFGVLGTASVAALALVAAHTHAGSSTPASDVATSSVASSSASATPTATPTSTSTGSSSLSTGSASSGSSSSASTVSGGS